MATSKGSKTGDTESLRYLAPVFRVADLERSLAFYRDKLGFELDFNYENFYASVRRDGCYLHLHCGPGTPRNPAEFELDQHIDVCVTVSDAAALFARFASAGVAFPVPLRTMPYGTEFYVRDPDGYVLGFVQPAR